MEPTLLSGALEPTTAPRASPRLRGVPLLAAAPAAALEALEKTAETMQVRAGEWLFEAGEAADALYVVTSGRFRVVAETNATLRIVGPGALLGELAVLTESVRSASVQAVRDSQVVVLAADRFSTLVESDAGFAAALARNLARQLQQSGGLLPPAATAAVYTVFASPGAVVQTFVDGLVEEFAALGPTETLRARTDDDAAEADAAVAQAESRARYVLLVTGDADGRGWRDFALRQSDRTILVTDGAPVTMQPPAVDDVVFVGEIRARTIAARLDELQPRTHHVVPSVESGGAARVARRLAGRSLGIVLSGGGARGFAHIGAIQALREAGLEPDRIGGCSIGSFIGAMTAIGLGTEAIGEVCERELVRRSPFSDYTVPRVSLIRARRAGAMLQRVFGDAVIEELARPLFTVSADLVASSLVVHRRGPVWQAVGASMSIPGLAPPVTVGSQLLVDGGVLNNLPVDLMEAEEGPIVAVDVIKRMEAPRAGRVAALPTITETLSRATVLGSVERSERNRGLATLTIVPDVQDVGLREFRQLRRAVDAGYRAAVASLEQGGADALRRALDRSAPAGSR